MLAKIDTEALRSKLDLIDLVGQDVALVAPAGEEGFLHGPCPFCGGRDRFKVFAREQRFFCWHCRRKGDVVQYLMYRRGLTFVDTCRLIETGEIACSLPPPAPVAPEPDPEPFDYDLWRHRLEPMIGKAAGHLYTGASDAARAAVAWLLGRGLALGDIGLYGLGYNEQWRTLYDDYRLPPGLLIPRFSPDPELPIMAVNVYLPRALHAKYGRRRFLKGSDVFTFFNGHRTRQADVVFITEGEMDCMLLNRFLSPMPSSVAITAGGNRVVPDDLTLLDGKQVILAFDADEGGELARADWLARLPGAVVAPALPDGQDITDFWRAGGDVKLWAETAVQSAVV